jgi:hypothetical protein
LTVLDEVGDDFIRGGIADDRPARHSNPEGRGRLPSAVGNVAGLAVFGDKPTLTGKRKKGIQIAGGNKDHIAPTPAIPSIGAAACDELFAVEMHHAISTVATPDKNFSFIDHGAKCNGKHGFLVGKSTFGLARTGPPPQTWVSSSPECLSWYKIKALGVAGLAG